MGMEGGDGEGSEGKGGGNGDLVLPCVHPL